MPKLPGRRGSFQKRAGVVNEYGSHRCPPFCMCTTDPGSGQSARQRELQDEQHERQEPLQHATSIERIID